MEIVTAAELQRTSSHTSNTSSRKSSRTRLRPQKHASSNSLRRARSPSDPKSLTSFPSLSPTPDSSPISSRTADFSTGAGGSRISSAQTTINGAVEANEERASRNTNNLSSSDKNHPTVRRISRAPQSLVGSLVASMPSNKRRSALFDDTPQDVAEVPGNLHHTSDENIEHTIARTGAVALVRQLAADLAQRDAQMTALRRKAEERERVLRKMLQECEVSNLDIETRLREMEKGLEGRETATARIRKNTTDSEEASHPEESMHERLATALSEEHVDQKDVLEYMDARTSAGHVYSDNDSDSLTQKQGGADKANDASKTWRSGWWGTSRKDSKVSVAGGKRDNEAESRTRSRASSGAKAPRKGLTEDLFMPPPPGANRPSSLRRMQNEAQEDGSSRRSSVSVTNWALRLVAGTAQPGRDSDKGSLRGRGNGDVDSRRDTRASSADSMNTPQLRGRTTTNGAAGRGQAHRSSLGPNGTIKSVSPETSRKTPNLISPSSGGGMGNLGPVEMDTILPEDSRPPTLVQQHNNFASSQEYLTDRFGFIYDQRRKKRQSEAAAALRKQKTSSHVESIGDARYALDGEEDDQAHAPASAIRPGSTHSSIEEQTEQQPPKRWTDFLKLATFPTELLSHTPSAAPITAVENVDIEYAAKTPSVTVQKRGSIPVLSSNPEPSPSRISSGNAEFAAPSVSAEAAGPVMPVGNQQDPVKALLEQLTELHDTLQREKEVKWNEFLRKVRAERRREGEAAAAVEGKLKILSMPETLILDGEIVGIAGLGNKGKVGRAKWKEFKQLVLGGIPVTYRAKIWAECSGASALRVPGYYDDIIQHGTDDPAIVSQIQMDITRTLTDNIFFRRGPGVHKLNEVLLAYSRRNPEVGYCQGMNLIAASLLLIMPTAEDAFWVLATMIENILPEKYYDHSLLTSRADQVVLRQYVAELLPKLSTHLDDLGIELEALTFQWFLSVFTDCLSAEALFRVWDMVLCLHDGSTFLFQVALALLKLNEAALLECDNPATIYHYINHQMTNHAISIDGLIQASEALKKVVRRKDVEERRALAVERELELMKQREELRAERAKKAKSKAPSVTSQTGKKREGEERPATAMIVKATQPDGEEAAATKPTAVANGPPTPASTSSSIREDEDVVASQCLEDLEAHKTPLPIDEEAMWRA